MFRSGYTDDEIVEPEPPSKDMIAIVWMLPDANNWSYLNGEGPFMTVNLNTRRFSMSCFGMTLTGVLCQNGYYHYD